MAKLKYFSFEAIENILKFVYEDTDDEDDNIEDDLNDLYGDDVDMQVETTGEYSLQKLVFDTYLLL